MVEGHIIPVLSRMQRDWLRGRRAAERPGFSGLSPARVGSPESSGRRGETGISGRTDEAEGRGADRELEDGVSLAKQDQAS